MGSDASVGSGCQELDSWEDYVGFGDSICREEEWI